MKWRFTRRCSSNYSLRDSFRTIYKSNSSTNRIILPVSFLLFFIVQISEYDSSSSLGSFFRAAPEKERLTKLSLCHRLPIAAIFKRNYTKMWGCKLVKLHFSCSLTPLAFTAVDFVRRKLANSAHVTFKWNTTMKQWSNKRNCLLYAYVNIVTFSLERCFQFSRVANARLTQYLTVLERLV